MALHGNIDVRKILDTDYNNEIYEVQDYLMLTGHMLAVSHTLPKMHGIHYQEIRNLKRSIRYEADLLIKWLLKTKVLLFSSV